jgi:8-oxo-dGTP pyrophosphatase MutT (NUDIX family)
MSDPFPITYPPNIPLDLLSKSTLLSRWRSTLAPSYQITSTIIHSFDVWPGPRIGFLELEVQYTLNSIPSSERIILSGCSVEIVLLIQSSTDGTFYTLLVEQPRIGCGRLTLEYPAGMADDSIHFREVAIRELEEECGIKATEDELIDLGELFEGCKQFNIFPAMFDEAMSVFLLKKSMTDQEIQALDRREGGVDEEEQIVTKVVKFEKVSELTADGCTLGITEVVKELLITGKI